jgi:hypothetical protein
VLAKSTTEKIAIERRSVASVTGAAGDDLLRQGLPAVLTDATRHWPALNKWTFDFFKSRFGTSFASAPASLKGDRSKLTRIGAYIDNLDSPSNIPGVWIDRQHQQPVGSAADSAHVSAPYLMGWHPFSTFPELYTDISPAPLGIEDWLLALDPVIRDVFQWVSGRDYWSIFIGPKGSLSELHQDYWHTHAFLAQIQGRKRCTLFAPVDSEFLYDGKVDPEDPDIEKFPLYARATVYECIIEPGDLLFIPANWWHHVRGLEKSITVSHNFFNQLNFSEHILSILRRTPKVIDALDQFPEWQAMLRPAWRSKGFVDV